MTGSEADAAMRARVTNLMMNIGQVNLVVTFIRKSAKNKNQFYNCKLKQIFLQYQWAGAAICVFYHNVNLIEQYRKIY